MTGDQEHRQESRHEIKQPTKNSNPLKFTIDEEKSRY